MLQQLDRKIDRYTRDLVALRGDDALDEVDAAEAAGAAASGDLSGDQAIIWAHDLEVEPGRTYHYRFVVELYNPFFGQTINLLEEQQDLAESLTISSAASAWSVATTSPLFS